MRTGSAAQHNSVRGDGTDYGEAAANASNWLQAHEALSRLAKSRALADAEEGRWLLAAFHSAAHVHLGFGSFAESVARLFGYKPRSTYEKLRVAAALEALPALARALEKGELNWSAVRELTRVAVAQTEREWLEVARGKTVHQLEALVAGKSPAIRPLRLTARPCGAMYFASTWLRRRSRSGVRRWRSCAETA